MAKITMSLNQIKEYNPGTKRFKKLLESRGGLSADYDEQIPLLDILESNGIKDAIWCFRVNWFEHKSVYMQFINNCAKRANKYAAASAAASAAAAYAADAATYDDATYDYAADAASASAAASALSDAAVDASEAADYAAYAADSASASAASAAAAASAYATYAATYASAASAASATYASAYAASAYADYDAAYAAAERQKQHQDLINIINSIESSNYLKLHQKGI